MRDKAAAEIGKIMIELTLKTEESYRLQIEHMRAAGLFKDREPLSYADMKALVATGNYDVKLS